MLIMTVQVSVMTWVMGPSATALRSSSQCVASTGKLAPKAHARAFACALYQRLPKNRSTVHMVMPAPSDGCHLSGILRPASSHSKPLMFMTCIGSMRRCLLCWWTEL